MSTPEQVQDSPIGWVRDHIHTYVSTNGCHGHILRGRPTLLMTIRGRKSGLLRRTGATYGQHGNDFIVVDSNGGSTNTPEWALNLKATPELDIQVGPDAMPALARFTVGAEREQLWELMLPVEEFFPAMQARTSRQFSVIRLHPVDGLHSRNQASNDA